MHRRRITDSTLLLALAACSSGSAPEEPFVVDLEVPGFSESDITVALRDEVYELALTEGIAYDETTLTLRLTSPTRDYMPGDVLVFSDAGDYIVLQIEESDSSDSGATYICSQPHISEVLTSGNLSFRVAPDFSSVPTSGMPGPNSSTGQVGPGNVIDLTNLSLFDITVGSDGQVDLENSSILGEGLIDSSAGIDSIDVSNSSSGFLRGRILSGGLTIHPTIDNHGRIDANGAFSYYGHIDAKIVYGFVIQFESSGSVDLEFHHDLLPPITVPIPGTAGALSAKLSIPGGAYLRSSATADCIVEYSAEYLYSFDYEAQDSPWGGFTWSWSGESSQVQTDRSVEMFFDGRVTAGLYVEPTVSIQALYAVGVSAWLRPFVETDLIVPWQPNQAELFLGIEGGLGFDVAGLYHYRSEDLLGLQPLSWDLVDSQGTGTETSAPLCPELAFTVPHGGSALPLEAQADTSGPLGFTVQSMPEHGFLGPVDPIDGTVLYTPNWGYTGPDRFEYTAYSGPLVGNTANVLLNVMDGTAPEGVFSYLSTVGAAVQFDANATTDSESEANLLQVRWDFESDGQWDTSWTTQKTASHVYPQLGTYVCRLGVLDPDGMIGVVTGLVMATPNGSGFGFWSLSDEGFIAGGQNGAFRAYDYPSEVVSSLWSLFNDGLSARLEWEDDSNCEGYNPNTQYGMAVRSITNQQTSLLTVSWSGMGETQDPSFELMSLYVDGVLIGSAHAPGGGLGCAGGMAPVVSSPAPPQQVVLVPGEHILAIDATTNDGLYHHEAWYQFELELQVLP